MSQLNYKIGPKIKAFRRQIGLQANKLASQLNISPSYLALIEGGKRKIDGELLLKICDELKINISDLTNKSDINMFNTISELLDDKLFDEAGASVKDSDGLADFIRSIDGVEVSFCITTSTATKISFRSRGKYKINDIAKKVGGGGHYFAAGCEIKDTELTDSIDFILKSLERKINSVD